MKSIRMLASAAAVLLVIAACGPEGIIPTPTVFTSQLAGENQVPPVATGAGGDVTATLTGSTLVLAGTFAGLTSDLVEIQGSSAHVHRAPAGENGPIVQSLTVVPTDARSGAIAGTLTLDDDQIEAFEAGEFYVNIHTEGNPTGELRAQIADDTPAYGAITHTFDGTLTPENEPHAVVSDATGSAMGVLRDDGTLTVSGSFAGLTSQLHDVSEELGSAHVHDAPFGVAGPVLFPLDVAAGDDMMSGRFGATAELTDEQIDELLRGGYYVNVHSGDFQAGEVRGQLFPTVVETTTTLGGEQQVPPVVTDASGTATAASDGFDLTVSGSFEGLESDLFEIGDLGPAHIHDAPVGQNGPVVFPLDVDATTARSGTFSLATEMTEEQRAAFVAGNHYVNVHTADDQGGEIRGQFDPFAANVDD